MAESEINVIAHLLTVEQNAFILTKDAQERANHILSDARAKADSDFTARFSASVKEMQADFEAKKKEASLSHKKTIDEYVSSVKEIPLSRDSFSSFVRQTLRQS